MCLTTSLRRPANTVNTIYGIDVIFITNHSKLGQNTLFYQQLHVCICEICYKNIYLKCLHCLFFYLSLQIIWILSESKSQFVYLSISTYIFRSRYFSFLLIYFKSLKKRKTCRLFQNCQWFSNYQYNHAYCYQEDAAIAMTTTCFGFRIATGSIVNYQARKTLL